jgi:6-phosphogluconolactonase
MVPEIWIDLPANLAARLAARIESESRVAVAARGRFSLALSGGSIGDTLFPRLSAAAVDWPRTDFFWCDERAVPLDHADSNYRLARVRWLEPAGVPSTRVHPMEADAGRLDASADAYAAELQRVLGEPPRLDVALLGVGTDGHVCSLFPHHPVLQEERKWVAAVSDSPKPQAARLTLTLPTLSNARLIVIAALGEQKAHIVQAALHADSPLPIALALQRAQKVVILLDSDV